MKLVLLLAAAACVCRGEEITFWIQPCRSGQPCARTDPELASWAFEAWAKAASGSLIVRQSPEQGARLRLYWSEAEPGRFGEARPIQVEGRPGAELHIRTVPARDNSLERDTIVYLTCLHEIGHALGLPHTRNFADIMYNFQYGGDIAEYFGRYRRKLRSRSDIRENSGLSMDDTTVLRQLWQK